MAVSYPTKALVLLFVLCPYLAASPADEILSYRSFEEARVRFERGDLIGAKASIDRAIEFYRDNSDALYLSAIIGDSLKEGADKAEAALDLALRNDRFRIYSPRDAMLLKAELALRRGDPSEARLLVSRFPDSDSDAAFTRIRAARLEGNRDAWYRGIEARLGSIPPDPRVARELLLFENKDSRYLPGARLVDKLLAELEAYARRDPEIMLLAVPFMPRLSDRQNAMAAWLSDGKPSIRAVAYALDAGARDEAWALREIARLKAEGPLNAGLLAASARAMRDAGSRAELARLAREGRLSLDIDSSGDGIADAAVEYKDGAIVSATFDKDQDGRAELSLSAWAQGYPAAGSLEIAGASVEAGWEAYPSLAWLAYTAEGRSYRYDIERGRLSWAPISLEALDPAIPAMQVPVASRLAPPPERAVALASRTVIEYFEDASRLETYLQDGAPRSAARFDPKGRWIESMRFEGGRLASSLQDLDGDGRFETLMRYAGAGKEALVVESVSQDLDGDGIYEYAEYPAAGAKEWDYDGDGAPDVRLERPAPGVERLLVAGKKGGPLDIGLESVAGLPVKAYRNGSALALIPDSAPSLYWIGEKLFDFGAKAPREDGFHEAGGRLILIASSGGRRFAEILR
jgi:hypothetical protein